MKWTLFRRHLKKPSFYLSNSNLIMKNQSDNTFNAKVNIVTYPEKVKYLDREKY